MGSQRTRKTHNKTRPTEPDDNHSPALLTLRTALTLWAGDHIAHAILAATSATTAGAAFCNRIINPH